MEAPDPAPIAVILRGPVCPTAAGEWVRFDVRIRNVGARPVAMVGVLGGSEQGVRLPHYLARVDGPAGARLPRASDFEMSDVLEPLLPGHFVHLDPGEEFDPTSGHGFMPVAMLNNLRPDHPGEYRVSLLVATAPPGDWRIDLRRPDAEAVRQHLAEVPTVTVTSNVVVHTVR